MVRPCLTRRAARSSPIEPNSGYPQYTMVCDQCHASACADVHTALTLALSPALMGGPKPSFSSTIFRPACSTHVGVACPTVCTGVHACLCLHRAAAATVHVCAQPASCCARQPRYKTTRTVVHVVLRLELALWLLVEPVAVGWAESACGRMCARVLACVLACLGLPTTHWTHFVLGASRHAMHACTLMMGIIIRKTHPHARVSQNAPCCQHGPWGRHGAGQGGEQRAHPHHRAAPAAAAAPVSPARRLHLGALLRRAACALVAPAAATAAAAAADC